LAVLRLITSLYLVAVCTGRSAGLSPLRMRRHDDEVVAYVKAVGTLGSGARNVLDGANAEKLIPNLNERLNRAA
jgi:hypothetical protein